jgi:ribulose-phosphate 3-epimerase
VAAGARVLVAGSAVFGAVSHKEAIGFEERVARYRTAIARIREAAGRAPDAAQ